MLKMCYNSLSNCTVQLLGFLHMPQVYNFKIIVGMYILVYKNSKIITYPQYEDVYIVVILF